MSDMLEHIFMAQVRLLMFASVRCTRDSDAKQLACGSELTTILWILNEHAGVFRIHRDGNNNKPQEFFFLLINMLAYCHVFLTAANCLGPHLDLLFSSVTHFVFAALSMYAQGITVPGARDKSFCKINEISNGCKG